MSFNFDSELFFISLSLILGPLIASLLPASLTTVPAFNSLVGTLTQTDYVSTWIRQLITVRNEAEYEKVALLSVVLVSGLLSLVGVMVWRKSPGLGSLVLYSAIASFFIRDRVTLH